MTPEVVATLDYWAEAICTWSPDTCDLPRLVAAYQRALLAL